MVGEEGEAARDQQRLQTGRLAGVHQGLCTRVELQAFVEYLLHGRHRHTLEQRDALAQALLVVADFTAHRRLGDGGHLSLAAGGIGDLVHALDVDQRRIHVERDEFEVAQAQRGGDVPGHEPGRQRCGHKKNGEGVRKGVIVLHRVLVRGHTACDA